MPIRIDCLADTTNDYDPRTDHNMTAVQGVTLIRFRKGIP